MNASARYTEATRAITALGLLGMLACAPPPVTTQVAPVPEASAASVEAPPAPLPPPIVVVPEVPKLDPLSEAPCRIAAGKHPVGTTRLSLRGVSFATFEDAHGVELRVAGDKAIVAVETADLAIVGETDAKSFAVIPSDEALIDGYLRPVRAQVDGVAGDRLTVRFAAPRHVVPTSPLTKTLPCSALSLGRRSRPPRVGTPMELGDGLKAPLRASPGGAVVARIVTPPKPKPRPKAKDDDGVKGGWGTPTEALPVNEEVLALGRKNGLVQVRILGVRSEVEGFLPASALRKPRPAMALLAALGGRAGAEIREGATHLRCAQPVTIYLRRGMEITQIGQYKANGLVVLPPAPKGASASEEATLATGEQRVFLGDPPASLWGDLDEASSGLGGIGLGQIGRAPRKPPPAPLPFVRADALRGCAPATPPAQK